MKKLFIFATILWLIHNTILALYNYFKIVKYSNIFFFYERAIHIVQSSLPINYPLIRQYHEKPLIKSLNFQYGNVSSFIYILLSTKKFFVQKMTTKKNENNIKQKRKCKMYPKRLQKKKRLQKQ